MERFADVLFSLMLSALLRQDFMQTSLKTVPCGFTELSEIFYGIKECLNHIFGFIVFTYFIVVKLFSVLYTVKKESFTI